MNFEGCDVNVIDMTTFLSLQCCKPHDCGGLDGTGAGKAAAFNFTKVVGYETMQVHLSVIFPVKMRAKIHLRVSVI